METNCPPTSGLEEVAADEAGFVSGVSPAMRALERAIADVAHSDIAVLLLGEAGTGKKTLAQRLHAASPRRKEPFLSLNCADLLPDFFDVEGTGNNGHARSIAARAGTLFFAEITNLSVACQSRFMHVLFGSDQQPPRSRIILSSCRNLEHELQQDRLREDLYYRIRGICLQVPPLRHRKEDIPGLIDFFLEKYSKKLQRPRPYLSPQTVHFLLEHPWPGNVRQLQATLKGIVLEGAEHMNPPVVPANVAPASAQEAGFLPLKHAARQASREAERELILHVLSHTQWNRKRAAKMLQISYKALLYKLKQIGLDNGPNAHE
jgi:two-component system response regulator AtoC